MKCKEHKSYGGKYKPRHKCLDCWKMYEVNLIKKIEEVNKDIDKIGEDVLKNNELGD